MEDRRTRCKSKSKKLMPVILALCTIAGTILAFFVFFTGKNYPDFFPEQISPSTSSELQSDTMPTPVPNTTPTPEPEPIEDSIEGQLTFDELFCTAQDLSNSGLHDEAIRKYIEAANSSSVDDLVSMAYYNIACEYDDIGNIEKSIEFYKKCLDVSPDDAGALWNLALTYESLEMSEDAVYYFQLYIDYYPNDSPVGQAQRYIDSH